MRAPKTWILAPLLVACREPGPCAPPGDSQPASVAGLLVSGVPSKPEASSADAVTFAGPALEPRCIADEAFTSAVGDDLSQKILGGFDDGDDRPKLDRRWEGPWSASGDVCWVRGALFPYQDEVAIPIARGASPAIVFVLTTDGGTPYLVGLLSTDLGVPCD